MEGGLSSDDDEETVLLDTLSGFEFEDLVGRILERSGVGRVERTLYTQDEGRDILVRSNEGLIVVECKHQPDSSVGRPILQKLHSAVISSGAIKGMLVTTGRFTHEAVEHAKKLSDLGTVVDMVDKPILVDMAARARIKLITRGESLSVWTVEVPSESQTRLTVGIFLARRVECRPRNPIDLLTRCERTMTYRPIYAIRYNVDATFQTSVGVIHRERASSVIMFDGNSGQLTRDDVVRFFEEEHQIGFTGTHNDFKGTLPTFRVDSTSLQKTAKSTIAKLHTRPISYYGKNNVRYSKLCEPGEHDIRILDTRQLYLPMISLSIGLRDYSYQLGGVQGVTGGLLSLSNNVGICRTCNSTIQGRGLLCDTCGKVTHSGGFRLKNVHGFSCGNCGRTTCRSDGSWRKRYLVWRQLLCPSCGNEMRMIGKIVRKLDLVVSRATRT